MLNVNAFEINPQPGDDAAPVVIKKRGRPKAFTTIKPNPFLREETETPRPRPKAKAKVSAEPSPTPSTNASDKPFQIVKYAPAEGISVDVRLEGSEALMTQKEIAALFGVNVSQISRHVKALRSAGEIPVIAFRATTAADGKTYSVEHYTPRDVMLIGFRCQSERGVAYRNWVVCRILGKPEQPRPPVPMTDQEIMARSRIIADATIARLTAEATIHLAVIEQKTAEVSQAQAKVAELDPDAAAARRLESGDGKCRVMEAGARLKLSWPALRDILLAQKRPWIHRREGRWVPYARMSAKKLMVVDYWFDQEAGKDRTDVFVTERGLVELGRLLEQPGLMPLPASRKGKWKPPLKA
jgi:hypothetical protein